MKADVFWGRVERLASEARKEMEKEPVMSMKPKELEEFMNGIVSQFLTDIDSLEYEWNLKSWQKWYDHERK